MAIDIVSQYESQSKRIPGYGHRYHDKDPRAVRLLDLAILEGAIGPHTKLALVIENILSEKKGICLNVDAEVTKTILVDGMRIPMEDTLKIESPGDIFKRNWEDQSADWDTEVQEYDL